MKRAQKIILLQQEVIKVDNHQRKISFTSVLNGMQVTMGALEGAGPTVLLPGGGARLQRRHGNRSQEGQMGERLESVGPQDVWPGRF